MRLNLRDCVLFGPALLAAALGSAGCVAAAPTDQSYGLGSGPDGGPLPAPQTYCSCSMSESNLNDVGPTPGNYNGTLCQEEDCGGRCRPYCLNPLAVCDNGTCVVSEKTMQDDPSRVDFSGNPICGRVGQPPCYLPGDATDPSPGFFCLGLDEAISSDADGTIASFTCVYGRGWDYLNDQPLPTDGAGHTLCNYNADCPSQSQICVPYLQSPSSSFAGVCTNSQFLTPYTVAIGGACLYDTDCANTNGTGQVNACVFGACTPLPL